MRAVDPGPVQGPDFDLLGLSEVKRDSRPKGEEREVVKQTTIRYKVEPRREVSQTIPHGKLDPRAREKATSLRYLFNEPVYVYDNVDRWICSVDRPYHDDTRKWFRVDFEDAP